MLKSLGVFYEIQEINEAYQGQLCKAFEEEIKKNSAATAEVVWYIVTYFYHESP